MLALDEKIELIFPQGETRLSVYVHEQFAMLLHLSVFPYYIWGCCYVQTTSAAES